MFFLLSALTLLLNSFIGGPQGLPRVLGEGQAVGGKVSCPLSQHKAADKGNLATWRLCVPHLGIHDGRKLEQKCSKQANQALRISAGLEIEHKGCKTAAVLLCYSVHFKGPSSSQERACLTLGRPQHEAKQNPVFKRVLRLEQPEFCAAEQQFQTPVRPTKAAQPSSAHKLEQQLQENA